VASGPLRLKLQVLATLKQLQNGSGLVGLVGVVNPGEKPHIERQPNASRHDIHIFCAIRESDIQGENPEEEGENREQTGYSFHVNVSLSIQKRRYTMLRPLRTVLDSKAAARGLGKQRADHNRDKGNDRAACRRQFSTSAQSRMRLC